MELSKTVIDAIIEEARHISYGKVIITLNEELSSVQITSERHVRIDNSQELAKDARARNAH